MSNAKDTARIQELTVSLARANLNLAERNNELDIAKARNRELERELSWLRERVEEMRHEARRAKEVSTGNPVSTPPIRRCDEQD